MVKQWRIERPGKESELLPALNQLSKEGWEIFDIIVWASWFAVVAYKEVSN